MLERGAGAGGLQELSQLVVFDSERGNSACDTPVFVCSDGWRGVCSGFWF